MCHLKEGFQTDAAGNIKPIQCQIKDGWCSVHKCSCTKDGYCPMEPAELREKRRKTGVARAVSEPQKESIEVFESAAGGHWVKVPIDRTIQELKHKQYDSLRLMFDEATAREMAGLNK